MRQEHDYSLKAHNTFGIEARCKRFIEFENVDELRQVINDIGNELRQGEPMLLLGGGSNLLLTGGRRTDQPGDDGSKVFRRAPHHRRRVLQPSL